MHTKQTLAMKMTYWFKVVSLGMILGLGLQFAQAWTAPTVAPPSGNVSGPVTLGNAAQHKTGYLGVGTGMTPLYPLVVGGDAMISGKVYSFSTVASDLGTTLATKDYVDSKAGGSGTPSSVGNYPSVIYCTQSNGTFALYFDSSYYNPGNPLHMSVQYTMLWRHQHNSSGSVNSNSLYTVRYHADGSFIATSLAGGNDCINKSLNQLKSENKAK